MVSKTDRPFETGAIPKSMTRGWPSSSIRMFSVSGPDAAHRTDERHRLHGPPGQDGHDPEQTWLILSNPITESVAADKFDHLVRTPLFDSDVKQASEMGMIHCA